MLYVPSVPQKIARDHLAANREAALFMGCGLGKTAVVLDVVNELFEDGAIMGLLVVAPIRVCNLTWPAEVLKWDQFSWMKVANLRTPEGWQSMEQGDAQIYLVNYEMLPLLQEKFLKGRRKLPFDVVVWDEITKAKNYKSKRIRAVAPYIRAKFTRHWGLTGTPTPKGLLDLFAPVRLLDGGERLGKAYGHYRTTYFRPTDYMEYNWVPQEGARERIYKRLQGFALTLRRSEWLDIPEVVQEDIEVVLDKEATEMYKELERELLLSFDEDGFVEAVNAAVLVNKLLQVTSGAVYLQDKVWKTINSAKTDALAKLLKSLKGQPVMVACQYKHEQDRIRAEYPEAVFFQDAKSHKEQENVAMAWNRGDIPILVANPASIGHGLNLQEGGSTVIWYTLPWSPELYDQFNARVARRGQEAVTTIYRLMTKDTVDYAVAESLRSKDTEQNALLDALRTWKRSRER